MATLIIPGAFQVSIRGICNGQDVVNVVGVMGEGVNASFVADKVRLAFRQSAGPLSQLPSGYVLTDVTAVDLSSASGAVTTVSDSAPGALLNNVSTMAACALVRLTSGTRARSRNGRIYHGPLTEVSINTDGRTLQASAITAIQSSWIAFESYLLSNGLTWGVISRKNSNITGFPQVSVSSVVATQRRRLRGRD